MRRLLQPVIERGMRGALGKQLAGVDPAELAAAGRRREAATVTIEMFGPERERDALTAEAERVLAFAAPGVDGSVRFAPLVTSP